MKDVFVSIFVILVIIIGIFALDYSSLMWESFIGPKRENVRREIFEQTKSYNQGQQQELMRLYVEYKRTKDPVEKKAIAGMVRHQFADYSSYNLSSELREFVSTCMNNY